MTRALKLGAIYGLSFFVVFSAPFLSAYNVVSLSELQKRLGNLNPTDKTKLWSKFQKTPRNLEVSHCRLMPFGKVVMGIFLK